MKRIKVDASKTYDVVIKSGAILETGDLVAELREPCKIVVVTDDNVSPLYSNIVTQSLKRMGFTVYEYIIPNGEKSKNINVCLKIIDFFSEKGMTRKDLVLCLGGGVVGDIAGFASSIYLRGIDYIGVPTTLLAMIDSSIGGKTGVNSNCGKNLIGAFHQPSLVICDPQTLDTLSDDDLLDGISEAIKYAVVKDKELFYILENKEFDRIKVIEKCINIKKELVKEDEFDNCQRKILNFGHTVGHAIEYLSDYKLSHGKSVAKGMNLIAKSSEIKGYSEKGCYNKINNMLKLYNFDTKIDFEINLINNTILNDKKRAGDNIDLIIPIDIGKSQIKTFKVSELINFLKLGEI